jgi:hypothetical protein
MVLMVTASALSRLLDPLSQTLTPEAARCLADFRVDPALQAQLDELADRCNEGLLTEAERAEYEDLVDGIALISILKSKAQRALSNLAAV